MQDGIHLTRMQRFWSALAVYLGKHAGIVAIVGLLITMVLGYGTTKLEFATGQDSYLNDTDQVFIDNVAYQDLFGGQAVLVVFKAAEGKTIADMMTVGNQEAFAELEAYFKDQPDCDPNDPDDEDCLIDNVVTPKTALEWTNNLLVNKPDGTPAEDPTQSAAGLALLHAIEDDPDEAAKAIRFGASAASAERLAEIPAEDRNFANPEWIDFLLYDNEKDPANTADTRDDEYPNTDDIRKAQRPVFPDNTHMQLIVRLTGNASLEQEAAGAIKVRDKVEEFVAEGRFENVDLTPREDGAEGAIQGVTVTGAAYLLKDINDYLKGGMLQLGAIAVVIMTIILLVLFDVRWRLLPLAVILFGVTWAFGLAGYLGIPLTLVTIAGLPVMLGIGIDYAIQMHARVEEEVIVDRASHPIQETARGLCPALLVVTFDAVFAFAALRWAKVPMIRDFGLLLAVGIAVICLASIVIPLATLGIREYKSPTHRGDFREGVLGRLTVWLGNLPMWLGPLLAVMSLGIFAWGIVVEEELELQTDPVQWVNQSSRNLEDFRFVEEETGSSSELAFFIQAETEELLFSQEMVDFIAPYSEGLLANYGGEIPEGKISPELLTATSLITTVDYAIEIPGTTNLSPRAEDVQAAYDLAPEDIQVSTVNPEALAMNLIFRYGDRSLQERQETVSQVRDAIENSEEGLALADELSLARPPEGITATPSGLAIVGIGLLENLEANRILLTYLAILFVGLFLAVRLKSVVRSLLSLVPVLIAVGAASIVAWAFDLKLSPMTAVGGPLVVAACTEFTSLILLRYLEERRRGLWPRQAVDVAAARTGRAFIVSALTAISGVLVISTSSLPLLRDFGRIVGMNVAVALATALTVLPPLLVWADQRGWVSKGEIPDELLKATTPKWAGPEPTEIEHVDPTSPETVGVFDDTGAPGTPSGGAPEAPGSPPPTNFA